MLPADARDLKPKASAAPMSRALIVISTVLVENSLSMPI